MRLLREDHLRGRSKLDITETLHLPVGGWRVGQQLPSNNNNGHLAFHHNARADVVCPVYALQDSVFESATSSFSML